MAGRRRQICARPRNRADRLCQNPVPPRQGRSGEPALTGTGPARLLFANSKLRRNCMIGKTLVAIAAALLLSAQLHPQTNQGTAPDVTSGPAAGTPAHMNSPQAGPLETPHQRDMVGDQSQSVRDKADQKAKQMTPGKNDETGATGSSSPSPGLTR